MKSCPEFFLFQGTGGISRRSFLRQAATGIGALTLPSAIFGTSAAQATRHRSHQHYDIVDVRRTTVRVPYREIPGRNMARELPHWMYSEIFEVELKSGEVGIGETLLYYTWGATDDEDVRRVEKKNAVEMMWDDSLGAGLQMALFDATARTAEVPVHALLGQKQNRCTPLSWWNIDTSAEDMAVECKEAYRQGYMAYKTKGRPWIDVWAQVEVSAKEVPESFKIDMDFNDTLLDAQRAIPILQDLEKHPQVGIYESPIFQSDIEGNKAIRAATRVPVAMHYGNPQPLVALREDVCDGFVIGGGARRVMEQGAVSAMADKPFWLQLVGTSITASFSLHLGGVLSHATWPAVNCHQLYTHTMLTKPIQVSQGLAAVPDEPGLGYELDRDAVNALRITKPVRRPDPARLIETTWLDGRTMYFGNTGGVNFVLNPARQGKVPFFERGVKTRLVPNDGSSKWRDLYERASKAPYRVRE